MWSVTGRTQCLLRATLQRGALARILPASSTVDLDFSVRSLSSSNGGGKHNKFSPRRRPSPNYRPTKARGKHLKNVRADYEKQLEEFGEYDPDEERDKAELRNLRRQQDVYKGRQETVEDYLRDMDYLASGEGSTEELAYERRALNMECDTEEEKKEFMSGLNEMVEKGIVDDLDLEEIIPIQGDEEGDEEDEPAVFDNDIDMDDPVTGINPNQKAFGEWGELLVRVDRNIKLWRGGRIQSYRALVIGGNLNGCAGFGTGKAPAARDAVVAASRKCKRNIFFVDRYQNASLTRDLVGRSNSCKVVLRATQRGLRGNPLCVEILKYFGITNCTARCTQGNRTQFNVVRATFKALATHESMEDIAQKRGRRIVSIDRGRRLMH